MKMGRQWRVLGQQKKEKIVDRGKRKMASNNKAKREIKKIQAGYSGLAGDLQAAEIYLIPYQEAPVCEVGYEDHPTTIRQSEISSNGPPHLVRGGQGIHCQLV